MFVDTQKIINNKHMIDKLINKYAPSLCKTITDKLINKYVPPFQNNNYNIKKHHHR